MNIINIYDIDNMQLLAGDKIYHLYYYIMNHS